ncbi:MAG: EthD domain-containing protein [Pseudomonadota bacterium]
MTKPPATPGAKMIYLIKRRPEASREELVANWFANHMPSVIDSQISQKEKGRLHAWRYIATLFDANTQGEHLWDGMAQLWWDQALPAPKTPFGEPPQDTFQEKAQPYVPWATKEYVVMDGSLPLHPNTLNRAFPATRSGFFKVTFMVGTKPDTDHTLFFSHWLDVHIPNVEQTMQAVGGFRYVVSHSLNPDQEPFAGMAELYFPDASGWRAYKANIQPDGMERWASDDRTLVLRAHTEMVGIP